MDQGSAVMDDRLTDAVALYRDVGASARLRAAVLQGASDNVIALHQPRATTKARTPLRVGAAGVVVAAAVATFVLVTGDSGDDDPRPVDLSEVQTVVLADGTTADLNELWDPANHARVGALFAQHGATLLVDERLVAPGTDGEVFGVVLSPEVIDPVDSHTIRLNPGGLVVVQVGPTDAGWDDNKGLTDYQVLREIRDAVDHDDPVATGAALQQLGFTLRWRLNTAPGESHLVEAPPPGTGIILISLSDDDSTDTLTIDLDPPS